MGKRSLTLVILGPRQSAESTLTPQASSKRVHFDSERRTVVLDEAQCGPSLFTLLCSWLYGIRRCYQVNASQTLHPLKRGLWVGGVAQVAEALGWRL